jgi:hypothetical protein
MIMMMKNLKLDYDIDGYKNSSLHENHESAKFNK